jgi:hypothetical protein
MKNVVVNAWMIIVTMSQYNTDIIVDFLEMHAKDYNHVINMITVVYNCKFV